jgi:hypothetical protein
MENWKAATSKGCAMGQGVCSGSCRWYRETEPGEDEHLACGLLFELRRIGNGPVEAIILNLAELS